MTGDAAALYARGVPRPSSPDRSPTLGLLLGLLITHTAVVTLASDWRNGVTGDEPVLLGTMRDTDTPLSSMRWRTTKPDAS